MKWPQIISVIILSLVTSFLTTQYLLPNKNNQATPTKEAAYERVLRTGVIRCGYADWPPYVSMKDVGTGELKGIIPDVMEALATKLNVKIEWTENTGWGSFIESLRAQRIDVFCAGVFRNAQRGRYVGFSVPLFYSAVYPYVAVDEHRFDSDLSLVNQPDVRISGMDGEISDVIAKTEFSKATEVSLPQLGQITDILVNVAKHKADIVFSEASFANDYIKTNPGSLRALGDRPFQVFQTAFATDIHENALRDMLDDGLVQLHNEGIIEKILLKYGVDPKTFLRVAKPYQ